MDSQKQLKKRSAMLRATFIVLMAVALAGGAILSLPRQLAHAASTFIGCPGNTNQPSSSYPMYQVNVLTPTCGSNISGATTITLVAPGMMNVWASILHQPDATHTNPTGWDDRFQRVTPDITGNTPSTITFDANTFPHGPITIVLNAWDVPDGQTAQHSDSYFLQLYNTGGVSWDEGLQAAPTPAAAAGMTVVYQDDFSGPLSISPKGDGTTYATQKPDYPNGSQFGDAVMTDPSTGSYNPFAILDHKYLRIQAIKAPAGYVDPLGWGRTYESGLLSAGHVDGTSVGAVADGYFEARMALPPEQGTWPAFWNLGVDNLGPNGVAPAEMDTMEGYGQYPNIFCQTWHYWGNPSSSNGTCNNNNGGTSYDPAGVGIYGSNGMSAWHTYGLLVTPTSLNFYIDNILTWTQPASPDSQKAEFFILDLEMGGGWPDDLSRYNNQANMYVDWVRVWQPKVQPPGVPTGLQGTAPSSSQVNLSWNASTPGTNSVAGYNIYRNGSKVASTSSTSYQDTGLSANTTYNYTVDAYDAPGNTSAQSSAISVTTPQSAGSGAPPGSYRLVNVNSGLVLDVQGSSTTAGAPLVQSSSSGTSSQKWAYSLSPMNDGNYILENLGSQDFANVAYVSSADGAPIIQWNSNYGSNAEFNLVALGNGDYKIVIPYDNKVVDVQGSSTTAGASIIQDTWTSSTSQEWQLVPVS